MKLLENLLQNNFDQRPKHSSYFSFAISLAGSAGFSASCTPSFSSLNFDESAYSLDPVRF